MFLTLKRIARFLKTWTRSRPRPQSFRRFQPALEHLEERAVPTVFRTLGTITSPNHLHTASVGQLTPIAPVTGPAAFAVIEDGQVVSGVFENIFDLQFSPNSQHLAFEGQTAQGIGVTDIALGATSLNFTPLSSPTVDAGSPTFNRINSGLTFSANSSSLSFDAAVGFSSVPETLALTNPTSIALAESTAASTFGQAVTFTATVTSLPGTVQPTTGVVQFFVDGTFAGQAGLPFSDTASITLKTLSAGTHSITAKYLGTGPGGFFASQQSLPVGEKVAPAASTTALTESSPTSVFGKSLTLEASVNSATPGLGTPGGSVSFFDNGNLLQTVNLNAQGDALLNIATLLAGSHSLTAHYNGSADFTASQSGALGETVAQDVTTLVLNESAGSSVFGQTVSFAASVIVAAPGSGTPIGSVSFFDNGKPLSTVPLNGSGVALLSIASLPAVELHHRELWRPRELGGLALDGRDGYGESEDQRGVSLT